MDGSPFAVWADVGVGLGGVGITLEEIWLRGSDRTRNDRQGLGLVR